MPTEIRHELERVVRQIDPTDLEHYFSRLKDNHSRNRVGSLTPEQQRFMHAYQTNGDSEQTRIDYLRALLSAAGRS